MTVAPSLRPHHPIMNPKRHALEPVPFRAGFPHFTQSTQGTSTECARLSDQDNDERGLSPRERSAERMIEQRPIPERRQASAALDEARLRQQAIGVRLRQMFDEVVNEDVPAEFLEILRRADERGSNGEGGR